MDRLQQLSDIEELRALKADYFYNLDHKLWDAWIALFADDAYLMFDVGMPDEHGNSPKQKIEGAKAIVAHLSGTLNDTQTVHHGHTFQVEFLSDSEAKGRWAMQDIIEYADGSLLRAYGHYHETYRKIDGTWRFTSVYLTRLRRELTDAAGVMTTGVYSAR